MTDFATKQAEATTPPLDPHKHVNYAVGMVLGVEDFTQEFTYLSALNQWLTRDLIGYGTVSGLQVTLSDTTPVTATSNPQINVSSGVAITPPGQLVRITQDQCAKINDWLSQNKQTIDSIITTGANGTLKTYVTLCYNNLPTDEVPIPGEPCRDEKDILRPSRLTDDFDLKLIVPTADPPVTPPDQQTEEAIRAFIALLKQVQVVNNGPSLSPDDFETAIKNIKTSTTPYTFDPSTSLPVRIPASQVGDYMSRAFRIWATQHTDKWRDKNAKFGDAPQEACLALAEVDIQVSKDDNGVWSVTTGNGTVTLKLDPHRPYLIPLRLLQEWLLNGPAQSPIAVVAGGMFQFPVNANNQLTATNVFNTLSQHNQLTATHVGTDLFLLELEGGFQKNGKYLVKGTPIGTFTSPGQTFEYISSSNPDPGLVAALAPKRVDNGWIVRVRGANAANADTGFMVEISQIA
jgi:hypothetical protein